MKPPRLIVPCAARITPDLPIIELPPLGVNLPASDLAPERSYAAVPNGGPSDLAPARSHDAASRGATAASLEASIRFLSAASAGQHPFKEQRGYIYADATAEAPTLLGICDGVSGVQKLGLPPDELPKELLRECRASLEARMDRRQRSQDVLGSAEEEEHCHWLRRLLIEAYDNTTALGATTVLLAAMDDDGRNLAVVNIGDCGLLLLRPMAPSRALEVAFRTEPSRYDASRPVQIARFEDLQVLDAETVIRDADVTMVACEHGDLLVLGTDGIFDNLREDEIVKIVAAHCAPRVSVEDLSRARDGSERTPTAEQLAETADALVAAAIRNVRLNADGTMDTRLSLGDVLGANLDKPCGNADDTTAIVALAVEVEDSEAYEEFYFARARASRLRARGRQSQNALFGSCCHVDVDPEEERFRCQRACGGDAEDSKCLVA